MPGTSQKSLMTWLSGQPLFDGLACQTGRPLWLNSWSHLFVQVCHSRLRLSDYACRTITHVTFLESSTVLPMSGYLKAPHCEQTCFAGICRALGWLKRFDESSICGLLQGSVRKRRDRFTLPKGNRNLQELHAKKGRLLVEVCCTVTAASFAA